MTAIADQLAGHVVDLPQGFALVPGPLPDPDDDAPRCSWPPGQPFWHLAAAWERAALDASDAGHVAYVEADLFGDAGIQAATVWHHRTPVLGPVTVSWPRARRSDATPIEQVLELLGVRNAGSANPFNALDPGRHRHTEDWTHEPAG